MRLRDLGYMLGARGFGSDEKKLSSEAQTPFFARFLLTATLCRMIMEPFCFVGSYSVISYHVESLRHLQRGLNRARPTVF